MGYQFNPLHCLRAVQGLLALITLSLFASVSSYLNSLPTPPTPPTIAFPIFVSTMTLLISLPYLLLAPHYFPGLAHKYAMLTVEAVTMILWFVAWVAPAAYVSSLQICKGGVCSAARAGIVLAVFEWLTFGCTSLLAGRYCFSFLRGDSTGSKWKLFRKDGTNHTSHSNNSLRGLNISKPVPMSTSNGTGTPGIGLVMGGGTWPRKGDDTMV